MAVLLGMSGKFKSQKFELDQDDVPIGRHADNAICLDDPSVSGQHCTITRDGHRFTATDLDSTNGTRLNGAPITSARLKPKDILQVGSVELMFDGTDVEIEESEPSVETRVEVLAESPAIPATFQTASPFGKRRDGQKAWVFVTATLGVLILAALVFFIMRLL